MAIKKFNQMSGDGVLVKSFKTPTDIVIVGTDTSHESNVPGRQVELTDDETSFTLKSGDNDEYLTSDGYISIVTLDQYKQWVNDVDVDNYDFIDAVLVPKFSGDIKITVQDDNGDFINDFDLNDYILHQCDDDVSDVSLQLGDGFEIHPISKHNINSVANYI